MSHVTVNGRAAYWGELRIPRIGAWDADFGIERADDLEIAGAVEIAIGSLAWKGTARRSGEDKGILHVRVVGGAGGLAKALAPKAYQGVPVRIPLEDLLREAGETLAPTADAATLGVVLPKWNRRAGAAGIALGSLLEASGAAWRVLADGTVWVGPETWPASKLTDFAYIDQAPGSGAMEIVAAEPAVYPGEVFEGRRASVVTHRMDRRIRTRILFEEETAAADRLKGSLLALVRSAFPSIDFLASYPARVVGQNADGTLELAPDDTRIPGLSNVPIRYGLPGVKATIAPGARVLLEFAGGDPAMPIATVWEAATVTEIIVAGGTKGAARVDDGAKAATAMATWMGQVEVALNAIAAGSVSPLSTVPVTGAATVFGIITGGSSVVKVG